jgi:hypothetical protein
MKLTGSWRKLLNEKLCDLSSSPNITRVIKSWHIRWVRSVAQGAFKVLVEKSRKKKATLKT